MVPLEKVQDIRLSANCEFARKACVALSTSMNAHECMNGACALRYIVFPLAGCADTCGYVPPGTKYFKLEVQTVRNAAHMTFIALLQPSLPHMCLLVCAGWLFSAQGWS